MALSEVREHRLLGIYLNDHLAAATAGLELFQRAARANARTEIGPELARLCADIEEDRTALVVTMRALGIPRRQYKVALGWVGEKLGRLKLNGRFVSRSPLSTLVEVETLRLGVEGKVLGWRVLRTLAAADQRLDIGRIDDLISRAQRQIEVLDALHHQAALSARLAGNEALRALVDGRQATRGGSASARSGARVPRPSSGS